MGKKHDKTDTSKKPVPKRDLTPAERHRVQALREVRGDEDDCRLFKTVEVDEGDRTEVRPILKENLTTSDMMDEYGARLMEATGCSAQDSSKTLILQAAGALLHGHYSPNKYMEQLNEVGALMRELGPKDAIEGMLCSQIVVCQQKGFDLMARASGQTHPEWAKTHNNASAKFLARSQEALKKLIAYRKGNTHTQHVVIEHVTVADGGRAVIGHVEQHGRGASPSP